MKEKILEYVQSHKGLVIGLGIGVVSAVLLLTLGFWRTLLLAALCAVGAWVGNQIDKGADLTEKLYQAWQKIKAVFGPK